jgi:hypothetical protein
MTLNSLDRCCIGLEAGALKWSRLTPLNAFAQARRQAASRHPPILVAAPGPRPRRFGRQAMDSARSLSSSAIRGSSFAAASFQRGACLRRDPCASDSLAIGDEQVRRDARGETRIRVRAGMGGGHSFVTASVPTAVALSSSQGIDIVARLRWQAVALLRGGVADFRVVGLEQQSPDSDEIAGRRRRQ